MTSPLKDRAFVWLLHVGGASSPWRSSFPSPEPPKKPHSPSSNISGLAPASRRSPKDVQPWPMRKFYTRQGKVEEEIARRAAMGAALATTPPRGASKENWTDWNRYGWHGCPGKSTPNLFRGRLRHWSRLRAHGRARTGRRWQRHSDESIDRTAAPRRERAPPVRSGSSRANGVAVFTVGSPPGPGRCRAGRGSRRRSAGDGLLGDSELK